MHEFYKEIIQELLKGNIRDKNHLGRRKNWLAKKHGLNRVPTDADIFIASKYNPRLRDFLKMKPTRTASGVSVVAVMAKPHSCPHGKCVYCPGGVEYGAPQSYLGEEPALMRAKMNQFDPYKQTQNRLRQYLQTGHEFDKVELIVMGGTFNSLPKNYQERFVTECFRAMNDFPKKISRKTTLLAEQKKNGQSKIKNSGIIFETRPDHCSQQEIDEFLKLGGTHVELGVQTARPEVLKKIGRKHSLRDTIQATRRLKDAGFKITYHLMPFLPGWTMKSDQEMFKEIFQNPDYKPDELKIYPCLVIKGTELYKWWKKGKYVPGSDEIAVKMLSQVKKRIPPYVRIKRLMRDVPAPLIEAGPKKGNLRELVLKEMNKKGWKCNDIRCREAGLQSLRNKKIEGKIKLKQIKYEASKGTEYFLSFETSNTLIGFARLRIPHDPWRKELRNSAILRQLHVFGPLVPVNAKPEKRWQHKGFGKKLMREAEKIAIKQDCKKLAVISGIGVRPYYAKIGYKLEGDYMTKKL